MLNHKRLHEALPKLNFAPDIDVFASRLNNQFPSYISYRPDPGAKAVDVFSFDLSDVKFYAFPPFGVINPFLQKIAEEAATGVCVLPNWPTQSWYSKAMKMCIRDPVHLPCNQNVAFSVWQTRAGDSSSAQHTEPPSLPAVREKSAGMGLQKDTINVILASWRNSTSKQYNSYLLRWKAFCDQKQIPSENAGVLEGLAFLTHLRNQNPEEVGQLLAKHHG